MEIPLVNQHGNYQTWWDPTGLGGAVSLLRLQGDPLFYEGIEVLNA